MKSDEIDKTAGTWRPWEGPAVTAACVFLVLYAAKTISPALAGAAAIIFIIAGLAFLTFVRK